MEASKNLTHSNGPAEECNAQKLSSNFVKFGLLEDIRWQKQLPSEPCHGNKA